MKSSAARLVGSGQALEPATCTGIVDHRFDHIDSGKLSPAGARGVLAATVGDLHPVAVDAADRPLANRRRRRP